MEAWNREVLDYTYRKNAKTDVDTAFQSRGWIHIYIAKLPCPTQVRVRDGRVVCNYVYIILSKQFDRN